MARAPVSVVIPIYEPNLDHFNQTLSSLEGQSSPPAEVIVVDSTPRGRNTPTESITSFEPIAARMSELEAVGADVITEQAGIGEARRVGTGMATQPYLQHLDEDGVLTNPHHLDLAVDIVSQEGVAAAGGPADPIEGRLSSRATAIIERVVPSSLCTHYLFHPAELCADPSACFPFDGRGEDVTLRRQLKRHGRIVRDRRLLVLKDLPTRRQRSAMLMAAGAGGLWALDRL